jgi:hypothetical protein
MVEAIQWKRPMTLTNEMPSPAITTIIKMVESLPDDLQEQVVEQVRTYLAEIEEEQEWEESFKRTKHTLVAAAQKAKAEIAAGLATPMDYDRI